MVQIVDQRSTGDTIQRGLSYVSSGVVGLKLPVSQSQGVRRTWCLGRILIDLRLLLDAIELLCCFLVTTALEWLSMRFMGLSVHIIWFVSHQICMMWFEASS